MKSNTKNNTGAYRTSCYLGTVMLAISLGLSPVYGQEATDLGTVILGKGKREVQTQTAVPVTVLKQQEIDDRQAGTIAELVDSVPGVTLVNGANPQGSAINIRGFGANSGTFGNDQKVLIHIDGASVGSEELYRIGTQLYTDPSLYKEVTVNRGTVGSFEYGSGVIGGMVRLETKDASDFTDGQPGMRFRQTAQYTSNGNGAFSSSIFAWQPNEHSEFLANYIVRKNDNMKDGAGTVLNDTQARMPSYLLKGAVNFGDAEENRVEISYSNSSTSDNNVGYNTFFESTPNAFGNVNRDTNTRNFVTHYNYDPDHNLVNIEVHLSYADQKIDQEYIDGSSVCQTNPAAIPQCGTRPFSPALQDADHRYETTKLTVKNNMLLDTGPLAHDLRIGGELIRKKRLDASSAPGGRDNRLAAFIVDDMRYGRWIASPGVRYETSDITSSANSGLKYNNSALMGGLSVRYDLNDDFAVFASSAYTEGLPILDDLLNGTRMNKSEKSYTHELGFGYDNGKELSLKVNAYQSRLWDVTSYVSFTPGASTDQVDRKGIEVELSYTREDGVYVDLNASYSDAEATLESGARQDWAQNPANSINVTLGRKFENGLDVSWEGVANASRDINGDTDAGFLVNHLRATWIPGDSSFGLLEGAEFRVSIENVFEREYKPALATRNALGRNIKLSASKTF